MNPVTTIVTTDARRSTRNQFHLVLTLAAAIAVLGGSAGTADAQAPQEQRADAGTTGRGRPWDFLVTSGTMVPTGAQRDAVKRGNLTVAQFSYAVRQPVAITASLGWARSRDLAMPGDPKLNVFTYDVGAELRSRRWGARERVHLSGFAGLGAGARSYDHHRLERDATHAVSTYVSTGGEVGFRRVGLRVEVRDYVTGFTRQRGVTSDARNDLAVMVGLRFGAR